MLRLVSPAILALFLVAGCAGVPPSSPGSTPDPSSSRPEAGSAGKPGVSASTSEPRARVPLCADVPPITAPAEAYDDEPIYVGNEMPVEEIRAWAMSRPAYEDIWIDRDHLGWVTVAFSADAAERQAELDRDFPDVGVVAVEVETTSAELGALQQRVSTELSPLFPVSTGSLVNHGVVMIGLGVLSADRVAAVEERFLGEPVCVEGMDPAGLPAPGPQPLEGDGWRLLADEKTGLPYRTGIAFDRASLESLWREAQLSAPVPAVDFTSQVVIWFGAVYSGSCPDIRLDDVVVDEQAGLLHADIVDLHAGMACTADANPRAYMVALDRSRLPEPPFRMQLGDGDGLTEERTFVEVDLRVPGSVAAPGQVHGDPGLPEPQFVESGAVIEPGYEAAYRMSVHCGIEWLGELNGIAWRTDVPPGVTDYVPEAWQAVVTGETIVVSVLMEAGTAPTVAAMANGHVVVYRPTRQELPSCD